MKFLMMIKHSEDLRNQDIPPGLNDAMGKFVAESFENGTLKDTAGLKPTKFAYRIRQSGGKLKVTDGPFTEAKEVVGGYAIVEAKTEQEARALAQKFMQIHLDHWPEFEGECEVRQLEEY